MGFFPLCPCIGSVESYPWTTGEVPTQTLLKSNFIVWKEHWGKNQRPGSGIVSTGTSCVTLDKVLNLSEFPLLRLLNGDSEP